MNSVKKQSSSNFEVTTYHQQLQSIAANITNLEHLSTPTKDRRLSNIQNSFDPRAMSSRSLTASKRDSMQQQSMRMEHPQTPEMGQARYILAVKKTTREYSNTQPVTFYGTKNDTIQSIGSVQAHLKKHQQRLQNQRKKRKLLGNTQVLNFQNSKDDQTEEYNIVALEAKIKESRLMMEG